MCEIVEEIYSVAFLQGLTPDPVFTVWEWADKYRVLSPRSSAETGPWRTSRAPYLKEIMECLSAASPVEQIYFMKGAQIGATEVGNNWLGYVIDHAPGPFLGVQPTVDMAKRNSKQRIDPLIAECPQLMEKVMKKRSKDSSNTILMKEFPGGMMLLTGANSAVGLRSMPARYLFLDEVDGYPGDVDGEGDPVALAVARTRTFSRRRKIFAASTPTVAGRSRIEALFETSDQRRYYIPCPLCDHYQTLKWSGVVWEKGEPHTARYKCESCKGEFAEYHKTKFLAAGEWRADNPGVAQGKIVGFHLSALYSPLGWYSWANGADEWEKAKNTPELLRGFINTVLGETWKDRGDAPDWKRLYERRERYDFNTLPKGVLFLVAGVDIQKDRIEIEIVGYGRNKVSWSIDYRVLPGDTGHDVVWNNLEKVVHETWSLESGAQLPLKMVAVDSGYNTQVVYSWVRKFPSTRMVAIKGSSKLPLVFGRPGSVDVNVRGRTIRRGLKLWPVGVDLIKNELYGFLRQAKASVDELPPTGYCFFPQYSEEFFKQITAEELVIKIAKGYKRYEWQKIRERNEALDCRVYARAAAAICGLDRYKEEHWQKLENELGLLKPLEKKVSNVVTNRPKRERRRSSFWDKD